jgi:hypothetical protein
VIISRIVGKVLYLWAIDSWLFLYVNVSIGAVTCGNAVSRSFR